MRAVAAGWRGRGGDVLVPRPAARHELERVHAAGYLDRLAAAAGSPAVLDLDTYMSPASWDAAVLAAGAVLTAVEWVLGLDPPGGPPAPPAADPSEILRSAFALVRPPGHHALCDRAMGFCLINNVAVAAASALARGVERVAIVDYDVHHCNGTQWSFYDNPAVLVVSLHQHPFYPQTGAAGECGVRAGEGYTVNIPLAAGAGDGDYLLAIEAIVEPILAAFAPQLVILDTGFDAHDLDPLAQMRLTTAGFGRIAARLRAAATQWCGGRVVLATEGGYHLAALGESLWATIDAFADRPQAPAIETAGNAGVALPAPERGMRAVELVRAAQRRYWPGI
jgi:acetoin utilization deacetylase AcuC-like enzyme